MIAQVQRAQTIYLPFVVIAELRCGFLTGTRAKQNEAALMTFLANPNVAVLYPDDQTTHHYAAVYAHLRQQATPIPINDMWIAALCLQHHLTLYSRDAHFDHLSQLQRL